MGLVCPDVKEAHLYVSDNYVNKKYGGGGKIWFFENQKVYLV